MIELRYLMRAIPAPQYGPDISEMKPVLQYRTQALIYDMTGENSGYFWTEWQDVPTVTEES